MRVDPEQHVLRQLLESLTMLAGRLLLIVLPGVIGAGIALGAMSAGAAVGGLSGPTAFATAHSYRAAVITVGSLALVEIARRKVTP